MYFSEVIKMIEKNVKTKIRSSEEKKYLTKRLNIIEGQVRGIKEMVSNDRYCADILIQLSAISKGLESLGEEIIKNHLNTCLVEDIKNDNYESLNEIMDLYRRLYK